MGQQCAEGELRDYPERPATNEKWKLTSKGWVGQIVIDKDVALCLTPKVPVSNIFRMLEYAYRLESFEFLEGYVDCNTIEDFFERLANVLSLKIIDRAKKGFYKAYDIIEVQLPFIRGRIDINDVARHPWSIDIKCCYEEHTSDIEDNQILAWTLWKIAQSGLCSERVLPNVRRAYRSIQSFASLAPQKAEKCLNRVYNRLNCDYKPMHALCRFFLENSGPVHEVGEKSFFPFVVNMPRLFELFVAEWVRDHLPDNLILRYQEFQNFSNSVRFKVDIVIYDKETNDPIYVIDTKYKDNDSSLSSDVAQVVAYAEAKKCTEAILVYANPITQPIDTLIGRHRVRSLYFDVSKDLEDAGASFLQGLGVIEV